MQHAYKGYYYLLWKSAVSEWRLGFGKLQSQKPSMWPSDMGKGTECCGERLERAAASAVPPRNWHWDSLGRVRDSLGGNAHERERGEGAEIGGRTFKAGGRTNSCERRAGREEDWGGRVSGCSTSLSGGWVSQSKDCSPEEPYLELERISSSISVILFTGWDLGRFVAGVLNMLQLEAVHWPHSPGRFLLEDFSGIPPRLQQMASLANPSPDAKIEPPIPVPWHS